MALLCIDMLWGGPPPKDTPGFGIGSVRTIPRERPSTMMERRECVCEARASHSFRQWLLVTGQRHYRRQQVVQEYGWPQSYNNIRISTTSANGGTYAGQYPCDGWVENLEPTLITITYCISLNVLLNKIGTYRSIISRPYPNTAYCTYLIPISLHLIYQVLVKYIGVEPTYCTCFSEPTRYSSNK